MELDILEDNGFQLTLPSGATIGHRSLLRYFRQSVNYNKVSQDWQPASRWYSASVLKILVS